MSVETAGFREALARCAATWPTGVPRELLLYLDEPPQLPSGSPGKNGYLRLGFERRGAKSQLIDLDRRAPLLVQQALYWDEALPDLPCVFIISNAGGILQGDRNVIEIAVGPAADAHVTTQSATKIHEMDANHAIQYQRLTLADGAYLEYLPDPLIPHRHARFLTRTHIDIAPTASLIYSEILLGGRKYYRAGELFEYDLFSSTVAAQRPTGEELFVEKFVVEPGRRPVRASGVMGPYDVFGNVLVVTPRPHADAIFAQVGAERNETEGWAAGISRLPNEAGLVYKVLGMETLPVRARIREFWSVVRREITGADVPTEFAWRK
ncbi:MAG: urease accessory protein UreD [Planctomycetaceae bacterium]|nr:urease accessory protein UreD [Planctomycetaceae bacterium]